MSERYDDGGAADWLRDFVSRGEQEGSDGECILLAAQKLDLFAERISILQGSIEMLGDTLDRMRSVL